MSVDLVRSVKCSAKLAEVAVSRLLACYGEKNLQDEDGYIATLMRVFMEYPAAVVLHTVSPIHGLPSRLKFFPTIADVAVELSAVSKTMAEKINPATLPYERPTPDPLSRPPTDEARKSARQAWAAARAEIQENLAAERAKFLRVRPQTPSMPEDLKAGQETDDWLRANLRSQPALPSGELIALYHNRD